MECSLSVVDEKASKHLRPMPNNSLIMRVRRRRSSRRPVLGRGACQTPDQQWQRVSHATAAAPLGSPARSERRSGQIGAVRHGAGADAGGNHTTNTNTKCDGQTGGIEIGMLACCMTVTIWRSGNGGVRIKSHIFNIYISLSQAKCQPMTS